MENMMKIYEFKGFPNPARVRIALAEKGVFDKAEFIQVDVPAGEHLKPEYLAKNPSAVVPILELEDGSVISECIAITEYIDGMWGDQTLTGRSAMERAQISMIQRKVEAGFLDAVAAFFHHATPGLGPDVESYQNEDWGIKQREKALLTLQWMDGILCHQEYLAGDRFTVADITAFGGFMFAGFIEMDIPDTCIHVRAYAERLGNRPSILLAS
ncbi:MAG: glutathione S-transferase [Sneathiella sp.]|nr:glutathione S-transferase [Sneathiella sp.]